MDLEVGEGRPVCSVLEEEGWVWGWAISFSWTESGLGVLGEWLCCRTLEKNSEDRLRGGSIGAGAFERLKISMQSTSYLERLLNSGRSRTHVWECLEGDRTWRTWRKSRWKELIWGYFPYCEICG